MFARTESSPTEGLPLYLDLVKACGLIDSIREYMSVAGEQGWLNIQMVLALMFLNLVGGDYLDNLEHDAGLKQVLRETERIRQQGSGHGRVLWRRSRAQGVAHSRPPIDPLTASPFLSGNPGHLMGFRTN